MKLPRAMRINSARNGAKTQSAAQKIPLRFLRAFASLRKSFCLFDGIIFNRRSALIVVCSLPFAFPVPSPAQIVLSALEKTIGTQIPVPNITFEELKTKLASQDSSRYVLFDARPAEEYNVSHLARAIQIDPELPAEQFLAQYSDSLKNKNVVFYCSVGYRSSLFLRRVQRELQNRNVPAAFNLQGGIFRWYNEGNTVVDVRGPTDNVHPYDKFWGSLLKERKKTP